MDFKYLTVLCLAFTLICAPAFAADKLTEQSVRDYYEETKQISQKSFAEYSAFMDEHTAADAQITLNNETTIQGSPVDRQQLMIGKQKMMEGLEDEYNVSKNAKMDHKIDSIDIAPDGKSALVKDLTLIETDMIEPKSDNKMKLHVKSQSVCLDKVILSPSDVIQMQTSQCKTQTFITPQQ